jgi:hypothetical protein
MLKQLGSIVVISVSLMLILAFSGSPRLDFKSMSPRLKPKQIAGIVNSDMEASGLSNKGRVKLYKWAPDV